MIEDTSVVYTEIIESDLAFSKKLETLFNQKLEATKNLSIKFIFWRIRTC